LAHALHFPRTNQRPDFGLGQRGIAHPQGRGQLCQALGQRARDGPLGKNPVCGKYLWRER
jgi:hypothetical protein